MKIKVLTAAIAAFLIFPAFGTVAYAGGGPDTVEPTETAVVETTPEPNPFTPAGTGTVIDNATDADGKEFYTIMTPNENVFYLIIDRQRETENVYFLNAVTEQDLMALAEVSGDSGTSAIPDTTPAPEPTPEPTPEPAPEPEPEKGGNMGMMVVVVLVVLAGGGAAYYFKIYKPKQEQANISEDYDEYGEYEAEAEETEDDTPPWYEDEDESAGDGDE